MLLKALKTGVDILSHTSKAPLIDAEILLAHVLQKPRIFLHTWPDRNLSDEENCCFLDLLNRRKTGIPIAYLTGFQPFWSFNLMVNETTLIPRPETEHLVELALSKLDKNRAYQVVDLGTGSGAVGLAIAKERPKAQIFATDISHDALDIAMRNANALNINNIQFYQGNWCDALPANAYDMIVSNPPYVALNEVSLLSPEVHFEPSTALFSGENGLTDMAYILHQAKHYLKSGGYLFVEHGFSQGEEVRLLFETAGFEEIVTYLDYSGHERVSSGVGVVR